MRIGYEKGPIGELDWFIRLANAKLEGASEGEVLMLQEEFTALEKAHSKISDRWRFRPQVDGLKLVEVSFIPTPQDIIDVQKIIRSRLSELADRGLTVFPVMPTQMLIGYPRRLAKRDLTKSTPDFIVSYSVASPSFTKLVYYMGLLIEKSEKLVSRCPHCRNIFLQNRRNQEHCSRSCQSVAVMQRKRAEEKTNKGKIRMEKDAKKGGSRHGKEGR
jgi:hypothetical protein